MRHAVIDNDTIVNIIEIDPRNASDFGNAVTIPEGVGAGVGDTYRDGRFYRTDPETQQEEEIQPFDPLAETHKRLAQLQKNHDENKGEMIYGNLRNDETHNYQTESIRRFEQVGLAGKAGCLYAL